jgi:hypothetical protein
MENTTPVSVSIDPAIVEKMRLAASGEPVKKSQPDPKALPDSARSVMGQPHPTGRAALRMLEAEGYLWYILFRVRILFLKLAQKEYFCYNLKELMKMIV